MLGQPLEKTMAPHSSTLAWSTSGMGEPGGLPSIGSHRVRHDWSDLAAAAAAVQLYLNKIGKTVWPTKQMNISFTTLFPYWAMKI